VNANVAQGDLDGRDAEVPLNTSGSTGAATWSSGTSGDTVHIDEVVDHIRGPAVAPVILMYGDFECPYTRLAYREIQQVEQQLAGQVRYAFRHFPLTEIHPHALAASLAAEAAHKHLRFWDMHDLLFDQQKALADENLREYAAGLGLDLAQFETDSTSREVRDRVRRDQQSGRRSGHVNGTPTVFIDGVIHRDDYTANTLLERLRP
jgi:protein-disulfide isomerase